MKTRKPSAKSQPKVVLQLGSWGSYLDEAAELEALLRKRPACVRIELVGVGVQVHLIGRHTDPRADSAIVFLDQTLKP